MRAIVLTKNLKKIKSANYQYEFIDWLGKKFEIYKYGIGYDKYNSKDDFNEIVEKSSFGNKVDIVLFAHTWLNDDPNYQNISIHKNLNIKKDIPKIGFLNKEYVNLKEKLKFYKENNFDLILTHNHNFKDYENLTGKNFLFSPFASDNKIYFPKKKKGIDLMFSGIITPNYRHEFSDTRIKMQKKIFEDYNFFKIKKKEYKNFNIYWNNNLLLKNIIRDRFERLFRDSRLSYANKLSNSKLVFNTLSPSQLINPRFFESLSSGAIPICPETSAFKSIAGMDNVVIKTNKNLDDIHEKLSFYSNNLIEFNKLSEKAIKFSKNNTWEKRIESLINKIKTL